MKKILRRFSLYFLIVLIMSNYTFGQQLLVGCPNPLDPNDPLAYLLNTNSNSYKFRVTFNEKIVGTITENDCNNAIAYLNTSYLSTGISFVWDCQIGNILTDVHNDLYAININVSSGGDSGNAFTIPSTRISISKILLSAPHLIHEVGHCLGLLHTHNSALNETEQGTTTCEELVDESNCLTCGDCLCQTKATLKLATSDFDYIDSNGEITCTYVGTSQDSNLDFFNPDLDNYMSYATASLDPLEDCRNKFTTDQVQRMKNIIENSGYLDRARVYSSFNEIVPLLTPTEDEIGFNFGNDIVVDQDLFLDPGADLIMFGNYSIFLEEGVILEGIGIKVGNLCSEWQGIKIKGNGVQNTLTGLSLIDSEIYNARTGVSQSYGSFGGHMSLYDVDFIDCNRGIELMKLEDDQSIISHCNFINGSYGITTWRNDFTATACTFNGLTEAGVHGRGASPHIDGNEIANNNFTNCKTSIRLFYPTGLLGNTIIENNKFYKNGYDVHIMSGASSTGEQSKTTLSNNVFDDSSVGFFADGANAYLINKNDFINCGFANFSISAGIDGNLIDQNYYADNGLGAGYNGVNSDTELRQNCYDNHSFSDVYVDGVFTTQGNQVVANGNCFSLTNTEIYTGPTGPGFDYFEPDSGVPADPCVFVNSSGNFDIDFSTSVLLSNDCGASNVVINSPPTSGSPCNPHKTESDVKQAINDIYDLIDQITNNPLLDQETKDQLIEYYMKCLKRVKMLLVEILISISEVDEAIDTLKNDSRFEMQIKGYSILMGRDRYIDAQLYLNNLTSSNSEQSDYLMVQNLYLQNQLNPLFEPNQSELDDIYDAGIKNTTLAGFARSIYLYFTEEIIELDMTINGHDPNAPRSVQIINENLNVYPNPTRIGENLFLSIPEDIEVSIRFSINNVSGILEHSGFVDFENNTIPTNNLTSGVKFIKIHLPNGKISTSKIIILN